MHIILRYKLRVIISKRIYFFKPSLIDYATQGRQRHLVFQWFRSTSLGNIFLEFCTKIWACQIFLDSLEIRYFNFMSKTLRFVYIILYSLKIKPNIFCMVLHQSKNVLCTTLFILKNLSNIKYTKICKKKSLQTKYL